MSLTKGTLYMLLSPSQIIKNFFLLLTHQLPATNIAYHVLHGGATAFHPYFEAFLPHADASFPLSFLCKTGKLQSLPLLCSSHIHQFLFLKLLMSCVAFLCGKFTAKVSLLLPMSCGYRAALFSDNKPHQDGQGLKCLPALI